MADDGRSTGLWIVIGIAVVVGLLVVGLVAVPVLGSFVMDMGDQPPEGEMQPPGSFSVDDSEPVTFTRIGEPVDASLVEISVNGERIGTWGDLKDQDGTIDAGEELEVTEATAGDDVAIKWTGGDEPETLFVVTVTPA